MNELKSGSSGGERDCLSSENAGRSEWRATTTHHPRRGSWWLVIWMAL